MPQFKPTDERQRQINEYIRFVESRNGEHYKREDVIEAILWADTHRTALVSFNDTVVSVNELLSSLKADDAKVYFAIKMTWQLLNPNQNPDE